MILIYFRQLTEGDDEQRYNPVRRYSYSYRSVLADSYENTVWQVSR